MLATPPLKRGDQIVVLACPSLHKDYSGQIAEVLAVVDDGELTVRFAGSKKNLPLIWEDGDRWASADDPELKGSWLESFDPKKLDQAFLRHRPPTTEMASEMQLRLRGRLRQGTVRIWSEDEADRIVFAISQALQDGASSDAQIRPYYDAQGVDPFDDVESQLTAIRLAQFINACAHQRWCSQDDPRFINWLRATPESLKAIEMVAEGYELLGCRVGPHC